MAHHYTDGKPLVLGDRVCDGVWQGTVVFIIEEGEFRPPYVKEEWDFLRQGIGVTFNDDLFVYDEPDEEWIRLEE